MAQYLHFGILKLPFLIATLWPSGKRLHQYGKIHHAINWKTHYFDWAMFKSDVKLPEGR